MKDALFKILMFSFLVVVIIGGILYINKLGKEKAGEDIICDSPYIRHADGCCLDQDNNSICDSDEGIQPPNETAESVIETTPQELTPFEEEEEEETPAEEEEEEECTENILTDVNNCGECGNICANSHGTTACVSGVCDPSCNAGWDDCNGNPDDGCETTLESWSDCGECNNSCDPGESCVSGTCTLLGCPSGYDDCDDDPSNGCETNLQNNIDHCGSCGSECNNDHGTATCSSGLCIISCSSGWGDCDHNSSNGCEKPLNTILNCGSCDTMCTNSHGTTACISGGCVPSCAAGWGDCNGNPKDGCETTLESWSDCGECDNSCDPGEVCESGICESISDYCETSADCDDGNACTTDGCIFGMCAHSCKTGTKCDDGLKFTTNDLCRMVGDACMCLGE